MKSVKIKMLFFVILAAVTFQSCEKDEELTTDEDTFVAQNVNNSGNNNGGNNGNNNGGNNNPPGGTNVALLENNLIHEWTELLLEIERYAGGMRPNATARALAYIYLATYETALPGMRDYTSNEHRLQGFNIQNNRRPNRIHYGLALNNCFTKVLDHFLINLPSEQRDKIKALQEQIENDLPNNLSNRLVEDSKEWGDYVAKRVINYSQTDNAAEAQILEPQPTSYVPPTGDGYWTYSADPERALFPYWGSVRTFIIAPEETTSVTPMSYSENPNSPYFAQMMEVYNLNNAAKEGNTEQLWIAEFWSDDVEGLTFSPPARQFAIANQLIKKYNLNMEETLALYIKLGFSLNDAAVSTWKYKYQYMVMRPNVFIHEFIDPGFQTNLFRLVYWPNPSFPGYPSGHSCFASAAGGVFINTFGNATNFTDRSHEGRTEFQSTPRTFTSFEQMAEENGNSRIPLGVHIRMDCTEGLRLGYEISDAVNLYDLRENSILATTEN